MMLKSKLRFWIDKQYYDETSFEENSKLIIDEIKKAKTIRASLAVSLNFGAEAITIDDEIEPLIQNICFDSISKLFTFKAYKYPYFSLPGELLMSCTEDSVIIQMEESTTSWPRKELFTELYHCGCRYLKLMDNADFPEYKCNLEDLEAYRLACEKKLTENNYL